MAIQSTILSGIQQSVFSSLSAARSAAATGKILAARVSGLTSGYDASGNLVTGSSEANLSKTYLFLGKKIYGTFPNLPVELLGALGLSTNEAESGVVTSLSEYYTSSSITEILREIKLGNSAVSPSNTVVIGTSKDGDKSATTFDVNIDNVTIISAATGDNKGQLSVAPSALPFVTDVKISATSQNVMGAATAVSNSNSAITLGLSGGTEGQVIKVSGTSYVWADAAGVTLSGLSGVTVSAGTTENGITPYNIFSNLSISASESSSTSGIARTYVLVDKEGRQYGQTIKTINDAFLKDVQLSDDSALVFTWYVRNETGETELKQTSVNLSTLNSYSGSAAIEVDNTNQRISLISSTTAGNLLQILDNGAYVSAVTSVTVNGTEYSSEAINLGKLVSSVTTTVNGDDVPSSFSGEVTTGGNLNLNIALSASEVSFSPSATTGVNPSISGDNVQDVIEEIASALTASTSGVLTVTTNGSNGAVVTAGTYNPSASTTVFIPQLSALTIGDEAFTFTTSAESAHIATVSASAITFNYTGSGNTNWTKEEKTADWTLNELIDKLDNANVSGLSAISASHSESGTLVSLTLNESNTTPNDPSVSIVSSEEGANATGSITGNTATNAVKMSQNSANGLFVYIEIDGDDID